MNKIYYTSQELESLGFEYVNDGGEHYYQFIHNPEDYFNSPFIATDSYSVKVKEWAMSIEGNPLF